MTTTRENFMIEIVEPKSGAIVVCDTFAHCCACDDGIAAESDDIIATLDRGEFHTIGGGAAEAFIIRPAPLAAYQHQTSEA